MKSAEIPTTKMGQVRWAWPEIQAALAAGHTLQLVHQRLNEIGIAIGYRTLSLYIGRLERAQSMGRMHDVTAAQLSRKMKPATSSAGPSPGTAEVPTRAAEDPFANIRRRIALTGSLPAVGYRTTSRSGSATTKTAPRGTYCTMRVND